MQIVVFIVVGILQTWPTGLPVSAGNQVIFRNRGIYFNSEEKYIDRYKPVFMLFDSAIEEERDLKTLRYPANV